MNTRQQNKLHVLSVRLSSVQSGVRYSSVKSGVRYSSVKSGVRYSCVKIFNQHPQNIFKFPNNIHMGHTVAQLVEALRYKPEGRGFDSQWCHWNFSVT
jgi:hypothetical protein